MIIIKDTKQLQSIYNDITGYICHTHYAIEMCDSCQCSILSTIQMKAL